MPVVVRWLHFSSGVRLCGLHQTLIEALNVTRLDRRATLRRHESFSAA